MGGSSCVDLWRMTLPTDANAVNVKGKIEGRAVPRRVGSAASHPAGVTCLLLQLGTLKSSLALYHRWQRHQQQQQGLSLAKHYTILALVFASLGILQQ